MSRRAAFSFLTLVVLLAALLGTARPAAPRSRRRGAARLNRTRRRTCRPTGTSFPHIPFYAIGCTLDGHQRAAATAA